MPRFDEIAKLLERYIPVRETIAHLSLVSGRNSAEEEAQWAAEMRQLISITEAIAANLAVDAVAADDLDLTEKIERFIYPYHYEDDHFLGEPDEAEEVIARARVAIEAIRKRHEDRRPPWWSKLARSEKELLTTLNGRRLTVAEIDAEVHPSERQIKRVLKGLRNDGRVVNMSDVTKVIKAKGIPRYGYVRIDAPPKDLAEVISDYLNKSTCSNPAPHTDQIVGSESVQNNEHRS